MLATICYHCTFKNDLSSFSYFVEYFYHSFSTTFSTNTFVYLPICFDYYFTHCSVAIVKGALFIIIISHHIVVAKPTMFHIYAHSGCTRNVKTKCPLYFKWEVEIGNNSTENRPIFNPSPKGILTSSCAFYNTAWALWLWLLRGVHRLCLKGRIQWLPKTFELCRTFWVACRTFNWI